MAATPEEINNALAIISENLDALDKEQKKTARGYVELLKNNNTNRTPFYDAVFEALQQNGRVSVEEMAYFPAAPPKGQRGYRLKAIARAERKLGVNIKREGNGYVIDKDEELISGLLERLRTKESMDLRQWYNTKNNRLTLQYKQIEERLLKEGITIKSGVAKYDR